MAVEASKVFQYVVVILATASVIKFQQEMDTFPVFAPEAIANFTKKVEINIENITKKFSQDKPEETKVDFEPYLKRIWIPTTASVLPQMGESKNCLDQRKGHDESPNMAFFVKIGKTGSTTLLSLINARLSRRNGFYVTILEAENNIANPVQWRSILNQAVMGPCPKVLAGHWRYVDFYSKGFAKPKTFSLVRNPLERLQSWFYYMVCISKNTLTTNDLILLQQKIDIAPDRIIGKTFEDCIRHEENGCKLPVCTQMEYLCGNSDLCMKGCFDPKRANEALMHTVKNVDENYYIVGILEKFNLTLQIFEVLIPEYFDGAYELFYQGMAGKDFKMNLFKVY